MACELKITSITGIGLPGGPVSSFHVTGTGMSCPDGTTIIVTVKCGGKVTGTTVITSESWAIDIPATNLECICGHAVVEATVDCVPPGPLGGCTSGDFPPLFLECQPPASPCCPTASVSAMVTDECLAGERVVNLQSTITPAVDPTCPGILAQWEFGDGEWSMAFPAPPVVHIEPHAYPTPGPYTAILHILVPDGCPPSSATVGPLNPCGCDLDIASIDVLVSSGPEGCNADGTRTVNLDAVIIDPASLAQHYHWEFGEAGATQDIDTTSPGWPSPATTHNYPAPPPGSTDSVYTAVLTVTTDDPACLDTRSVMISVPACEGGLCPQVDTGSVTAEVQECNSDGTRTVVLEGTYTGGPVTEFVWDFDDGTSQTIPGAGGDPSTTHDYAPGSYTATLTIKGPTGCPDSSETVTFTVPECRGACCLDDGTCEDNQTPAECEAKGGTFMGFGTACASVDCTDDDGCGCPMWLVALLLGIGLGFSVILASLFLCLGVTPPAWLWAIAGVFVGLALLVLAICYFICWFSPCDCPSKCDWVLVTWKVFLALTVVALFLKGCCALSWWWFVILALFIGFLGPFIWWFNNCGPGKCKIYLELILALGTGSATLIPFIASLPGIGALISACGWWAVPAAAGGLIVLLGGLMAEAGCEAPP